MPRRAYPFDAFHATPLHYAPYLLATGCLYAQATLKQQNAPVAPRRTVEKRDRKLKLDGYVHLSLASQTPLLADKLARGYPHVLLMFSFDVLLAFPGSALLRFNAKAWAHREDFAPVIDPDEKSALLSEWQSGRYPSMELLVSGALPLHPYARTLLVASEAEAAWLNGLRPLCPADSLPLVVAPERFPPVRAVWDWRPFHAYAANCHEAQQILPPPPLPFD